MGLVIVTFDNSKKFHRKLFHTQRGNVLIFYYFNFAQSNFSLRLARNFSFSLLFHFLLTKWYVLIPGTLKRKSFTQLLKKNRLSRKSCRENKLLSSSESRWNWSFSSKTFSSARTFPWKMHFVERFPAYFPRELVQMNWRMSPSTRWQVPRHNRLSFSSWCSRFQLLFSGLRD